MQQNITEKCIFALQINFLSFSFVFYWIVAFKSHPLYIGNWPEVDIFLVIRKRKDERKIGNWWVEEVIFKSLYLPNSSVISRMWHKVNYFFKQSTAGLNSEFSFFYTGCLIEAKEPYLPYYLLIVGRTNGYMPFSRALVQREMQTVSSRIWTQIANSICYYDNCYTAYTFFFLM